MARGTLAALAGAWWLLAAGPNASAVAQSAGRADGATPREPAAEDRPDEPIRLPGTVYVGAADLDPTWVEPGQMAVGLHVGGPVSGRTRLVLSAVRGPVDLLSVLALTMRHGTAIRAELTHPRWHITAGDFVVHGHALTGSTLPADGASIEHRGRFVGTVKVGRPKFLWGGGGHVVHASAGIRTPLGPTSLVITDSERPPSAAARVAAPRRTDISSEADVEDLRRLTRVLAGNNTLRAFGIESDLKAGSHQLLLRGGMMRVEGPAGSRSSGATAEGRYAFTHPRGSMSASVQHSPPSVIGVFLPANALVMNGGLHVAGHTKAIAHAYTNSSSLIGIGQPVETEGASVGVQYLRDQSRVTLQANYRTLRGMGVDRISRTISANIGLPLQWLRLDGRAELGVADHNGARRPERAARLRAGFFDDRSVSASISANYEEYGITPARLRLDADGSVTIGSLLIEGGAGYGRGQLLGNQLHSWLSLEAPVRRSLTLLAGIDRVAWDYASSPYLLILRGAPELESPWRVTVGLRHDLSVPVPFLKGRDTGVVSQKSGKD